MRQRIKNRLDGLALILLLGGAVGFAASFILTLDKLKLLQNPSYIPPCNLNPILSCGSVMKSPQASVFGFANSLIGVAAFAAVMALGLAILAGGRFQRWFWRAVQAAAVLGLIFVHWLIYQSLYELGTLCPFCMGVWAVTILMFWYITLHNLKAGNLPWPDRSGRLAGFMARHHGDILLLWYLIILILVLQRFWYYWQTLI